MLMPQIDNFDTLGEALELLENVLSERGIRLDWGPKNTEMTLINTRRLLTVEDPYGVDVNIHPAIGKWHADKTGLQFYFDGDALPSFTAQTVQHVVTYTLEIVKEYRAGLRGA